MPLPQEVIEILSRISNKTNASVLNIHNTNISRIFPWALAKAKAGIVQNWLVYEIDLTQLFAKTMREKKVYAAPKTEYDYILAQQLNYDIFAFTALNAASSARFLPENIKTPIDLFKQVFDALNKGAKTKLISIVESNGRIFFIPMPILFQQIEDNNKAQDYFRASVGIFTDLVMAAEETAKTSLLIQSAIDLYAKRITGYLGLMDPKAIIADGEKNNGAITRPTLRTSFYSEVDFYPIESSNNATAFYLDLSLTPLASRILIKITDYDALVTAYHHDIKVMVKEKIATVKLTDAQQRVELDKALQTRAQQLSQALMSKSINLSASTHQEKECETLIAACENYASKINTAKSNLSLNLTAAQQLPVADLFAELNATLEVTPLQKEVSAIATEASALQQESKKIQAALALLDTQRVHAAQFNNPLHSALPVIFSKEPQVVALIEASTRLNLSLQNLQQKLSGIDLSLNAMADKAQPLKINIQNKLLSLQRDLDRQILQKPVLPQLAAQQAPIQPSFEFFNGAIKLDSKEEYKQTDDIHDVDGTDHFFIYVADTWTQFLSENTLATIKDKRKMFVGEHEQGLKFLKNRVPIKCSINNGPEKVYTLSYEYKFSDSPARFFYIDVMSETDKTKHMLVPVIYNKNGWHTTADVNKASSSQKVYELTIKDNVISSVAKESTLVAQRVYY